MDRHKVNLHAAITGNDRAWYDVIGQFRDKAAVFERQYWALMGRDSSVPTALRSEYNALVKRGGQIRSTIQSVTGGIDKATAFYDKWSGSGPRPMQNNLGALGIAFIPIAVIVAAVAAMGIFTVKYLALTTKLNRFDQLVAGGASIPQAIQVIKAASGTNGGLFAGAINFAMPVLILAGIYIFSRVKT